MHIPGEVRQEESGLPFRRLMGFLAASIVVTLASILAAAWLLPAFGGGFREYDEYDPPLPPPASKLGIYYDSIRDTADGVRRHEAERRALESYGWVDRERGIAHVPIDEAIDMALREGPQP
jgi:hypothetical protein